ncbi:transmembrane protein 205 [Nilaparvata lugens]|uniref:transmembrane protein 205 n=1 Tax=Nilaparvata lugens TaxID=108931 RepID=UPI00193E3652|nr:transmembrane protein 205 [Nilaparvata lugens]
MCARTDGSNKKSESSDGDETVYYYDTQLPPKQPPEDVSEQEDPEVVYSYSGPDTLAILTSHQRNALQLIHDAIDRFQTSNCYKILFRTTQPAHVISVISVATVASLLYSSEKTQWSSSPFTILLYLAAFSVHCGSQFWMTFISGLSLYFNLPRHVFGRVQKVLFPKYFGLNSFLSALILISFNRFSHQWDTATIIQEVLLISCFVIELAIRLYAVPPLLELITAKTEIELTAGVGQEVGYHDLGPLKHCPHYLAVHSSFRRVHLYVAIGNILSLVCTALHLQYIAQYWVARTACP